MATRAYRSKALSSLLALLFASLAAAGSVRAQQPTPTAEPTPPGFTMPVQPPRGWGAEQWARLREYCLHVAEKIQRHEPLTPEERSDDSCMVYDGPPPPSATGKLLPPPPPPLRVPPVSQPTAVPETSPQSSIGGAAITTASAVDPPVIGPFGTPFPGGGGDACTGSPPVQPPDVAADVSPAENAELLNEGLWVFDKQGAVSGQTPLSVFWCPSGSSSPLPGYGTNTLTDTQIAFDQIAQRWLATTLSIAPDKTGNRNLYLAASDTSSAAGTWTLYAYPNVCSFPTGTTTPDPDEPALGYNSNWIVVDVLCGVQGAAFGEDNILTVPHSSIMGSTLPSTLSWGIQQSNYFAGRPSRDIGATSASDSYPDVFLVSSQAPSGSSPYVVVQEIGPSTSNPPPITNAGPNGATLQSPGIGVAGDYQLTPAAQPGCSPSSNCAVTLKSARIRSVIVQKGNDGNHYLLTSFMAEDSADQTAQSLYFLG